MTPEVRDKLSKILAMLTSPHDGERLAAATRFSAILAANDIHPSQVLSSGSGLTEKQMSRIYAEGYAKGVSDTEQKLKAEESANPSARVGKQAHRLVTILNAGDDAIDEGRGYLSAWEIEFLTNMGARFDIYAKQTYISAKQWEVLARIEEKLKRDGFISP